MTISETYIYVTIISSIFSGLAALIISTIYYKRHENRKIRIDTLKRIISNRYDLKGDEFTRSLNEIFIVFRKSKSVMKALSDFHERTITPNISNEDALLKLLKAMCDDLSIKYDDFNDSFFLRPFNTKENSKSKI